MRTTRRVAYGALVLAAFAAGAGLYGNVELHGQGEDIARTIQLRQQDLRQGCERGNMQVRTPARVTAANLRDVLQVFVDLPRDPNATPQVKSALARFEAAIPRLNLAVSQLADVNCATLYGPDEP